LVDVQIYFYILSIIFLSRVSTLTRDIVIDIDIANLSVCLSSVRPSVRNVPVLDENGSTYCHSFFTVR